jgi:hypothetical protein
MMYTSKQSGVLNRTAQHLNTQNNEQSSYSNRNSHNQCIHWLLCWTNEHDQ